MNKRLLLTVVVSLVLISAKAQWSSGTGRVYLTSSTNSVGIGTSNPSQKLHIANPADTWMLIESLNPTVTSTKAGIMFSQATNVKFSLYYDVLSSQFKFLGSNDLDAAPRLLFPLQNKNVGLALDNTGYVGIGTPNPLQKLHLTTSGDTYAMIEGGAGNSKAGILFSSGGNEFRMQYDNSISSFAIRSAVENFPRLQLPSASSNIYLLPNGNGSIGIGKTNPSPSYIMDVNGYINATGLFINGQPVGASGPVPPSETYWAPLEPGMIFTSNNVRIGNPSYNDQPNSSYKLDVGGTLNADAIMLNDVPLTPNKWMVINPSTIVFSNGTPVTVGIGTSTPSTAYQLDINGALNATSIYKNGLPLESSQWTSAGTGSSSYISYLNKVVIGGSTSSSYRLNVVGSLNATSIYLNGSPLNNTNQWTTYNSGLYFNGTGAVGIGTTTPSSTYKLDVNGIVNATGFKINGSDFSTSQWTTISGTSDIYYTTGNVGVGTTTPQRKFEVVVNSNSNASDMAAFGHLIASGQYSGIQFGYMQSGNLTYRKSALVFERKDADARGRIHLLNNTNADNSSATLADSKMVIDEVGNIGIGVGTANPATKMHVAGDLTIDAATAKIFTGTGASDLGRFLEINNSIGNQTPSRMKVGGVLVSDSYNYATPEKNDLIVKGRIGIGTTLATNPNNYSLIVNGKASASQFYINDQLVVSSQWTNSGSNIHFSSGAVGIGTTLASNPNNYKLGVNGKVGAKEFRVENTSATWPDYVFEPSYELKPLEEVARYIQTNKHLQEIPSAEVIVKEGYDVGSMDAALLKKIEELTLYLIDQDKKNKAQEEKIKLLEQQLNELKNK